MSKTRLSKIIKDIFHRAVEARIDIKNYGEDENDLLLTNISDDKCVISKPAWFSKGGVGYSLRSIAGSLKFSITFKQSGTFKLFLHTEPFVTDDKMKVPVWIDYTYLSIDDRVIFNEKKETWHDKPFVIEQSVKDGAEMTIELAWFPHIYENDSFEEMLSHLFNRSASKLLPPPSAQLRRLDKQIDLSKVTFSVFGNCVSRDTVEVLGCHVNRFIQDISPISASYGSPLVGRDKFTEENIADYLLNPKLNHFSVRNTMLDINKDLYDYLFQVKSDWLILDVGCLRFRTLIGKKGDAAVTEFLYNRLKDVLDKEEFNLVRVTDMDEETFSKCMDKYISAILKGYDENKIIVVEEYLVGDYVDSERIGIHPFSYAIKERNYDIIRGYNYLKNQLKKAHYIPFLQNVISDEKHKWGNEPLHYVREYYEYGSEAIKLIVKQLPIEEEKIKIEELRDYYSRKIEMEYLYFEMNSIF